MNIEKESGINPEQLDFSNEDVTRHTLEEGTPEDLEKLRIFHNLTKEQVELFSYYAKLRRKTIDQMKEEIKIRKKENPLATEEELSMGAYKGSIEPQVIDMVLKLRQKGYTTFTSGFRGFNKQEISFEKDHLKNFQLPENLINDLKERGVDIVVKPKSISFSCNSNLNLNEIQKIWEDIEYALPDLGEKAEPSNIRSAKSFREKQVEIKK